MGERERPGLDFTLRDIVPMMDAWLDDKVTAPYVSQPLAQDWARVAKAVEEAGEAVDALIGLTGQNPRKGRYGELNDLLGELADVALSGIYAIQHFTKNVDVTFDIVANRAIKQALRVDGADWTVR